MSLPRRANRPYDNHYSFMPNDPYPPSPRGRPFAQSRDSLHPPSLTSPGGTVSTATSASRSPRDRPRSLLPRSYDPHTSSQRSAPRIANHDNYLSDGPYDHQDHDTEIDTDQFPSFARHWYSSHRPTAVLTTRSQTPTISPLSTPHTPLTNTTHLTPTTHSRSNRFLIPVTIPSPPLMTATPETFFLG
jgi:hypothetical protein